MSKVYYQLVNQMRVSRGLINTLTKLSLGSISRTNQVQHLSPLHTNLPLYCVKHTENESAEGEAQKDSRQIDPAKDRTKVIPVENSIRYLKSSAYKQTYGDQFVWEQYRRNHKGLFPPRKTRKTCVRAGVISTGNPCPICRDEYLVLDHRNIDLLRQFISPQSGEVLSYSRTGLCQKRHFELTVAVERAKDHGLLEYDIPFREYDYSEYYSKEELSKAQLYESEQRGK